MSGDGEVAAGEGGEPMNKKKPSQDDQFFNPDDIAQAILLDYLYDPNPNEAPSKESLNKGRFTLASWRNDFYQWTAGRWERINDVEIDLQITKHLQSHNEGIDVCTGQAPKVTIHKNLVSNIRLCLAARVLRPESRILNVWDNIEQNTLTTVSMKNGLLVLRQDGQVELIPHTPDYFTFVQLPYDYDPDAECPLWHGFLCDVMLKRADYILLLQQWLGYLLRPDLRLQKFLLCVGEGANGKTVFSEVVQALLGRENCSQVPISRFGNPFALVGTLGKILNVTTEGVGLIEEVAETTLKSFTSGDQMTFERKYRDSVSDTPTAKVMICTNDLPRFGDKSQAIWRRILLVPFDKTVAEEQQIDTLANDLKKELPGLLNWAIEGLRNLNAAGRFTMPADSKAMLEEYRRDANPARAYLLENYQPSNNGEYVGCETLYNDYKSYCNSKGYRPLADRTFGKEVHRAFPDIKRKRPGSGNSRDWMYDGITSITSYTSQENLSLSAYEDRG
jgi:P4 family phage/plasmid primase-like protien